MKKQKIFTLALLSMLLLLSACGGSAKSNGNTILNLATDVTPDNLNYQTTSLSINFDIAGQIMEGLVEYDLERKIVPAGAEKWEISSDNLTYTFHLRKNAKWTNNETVTANDYLFAWQNLAATKDAPYRSFIEIFKNGAAILAGTAEPDTLGVTVKDDYTLVVELEKPVAFFLDYMAFSSFLPLNETAYTEIGAANYGTSVDTLVTNGAFNLSVFTPSAEVQFVKNPEYWNAKTVQLDGVSLKVVTEPSTQALMFDNNELDVLRLTGSLIDQYAGDPNIEPFLENSTAYMYLSGETATPEPVLDSTNFRLAIAHAFDKSILTDQIRRDGSVPLEGIVPTEFGKVGDTFFRDFVTTSNKPIYDVAKAQSYLAAAKAELGDTPLTFTIKFLDRSPNKNIFENIKSQLEKNLPGVTINIEAVPSQLLYPMVKKFEVPSAGLSWGADFFDISTFFVLIDPNSSYNYGVYKNPEIGALLEKAESASVANDPEARAKLYAEAEAIAVESGRVIPLYQPGGQYNIKPTIKNWVRGASTPTITYKYVTKNA